MTNPFSTPELLKKKLKDRDFQLQQVNWIKNVLRRYENDEEYLQLCLAPSTPVTTELIRKVMARMTPFVSLGTPAHDAGHHVRDGLDGAALLAKDLFLRSGYRNDLDSAFWASMFHDGTTGVQHRYIDTEWELNHGELMAVLFYNLMADLLPEPVRLATSYAIAAHPHSTKDITVKNGIVRKVWNDKLFYHEGHPVGLAVWVCRWSDRLENGGDPATHLTRHALAATDGALVGGMDLHHIDGWYKFQDQLKYIFTPKACVTEVPVNDAEGNQVIKDGVPQVLKFPSMLQHLQGYRISAGPNWSVYNQHDSLSPSMKKLMGWKVAKSIELVETVTNTTGTPDFEVFVKLMRMVSGYPVNDAGLKAIEMVRDLWNLNTPEDQAHWANGFRMAQTSYYEWLTVLSDEISGATDPTVRAFAPLVPEMIAKVTQF